LRNQEPGTRARTRPRHARAGRPWLSNLRMAFLIVFPLLLAWALIPASAKPGREPAGTAAAAPARDTVRRAARAPGAGEATPTTRPRRPTTTRPTATTGAPASTKPKPKPTAAPTTATPAPGSQSGATKLASDLFARLNAERRARGLAELDWDDDLARIAADWSTRMARTGDFSHRDLGAAGSLPGISRFSALGENIAWVEGYPSMGYQLHFGWMRSSGHRANQLQPGFDAVGIAVVCDGGRAWATQNFGRLDASRAPPMSSATPSEDPIVATRADGLHC
jgi:uncharacterized protein YkwD